MLWQSASPEADIFGSAGFAWDWSHSDRTGGISAGSNFAGTRVGDRTGNRIGDRTGGRTGDRAGHRTGGRTGGRRTGNRTGNRAGNRTGSRTGGRRTGNRSNLTLTRQPDLVLITWSRNPLNPKDSSRIVSAVIIGSAQPCNAQLKDGDLLSNALNCLIRNNFFVVVQRNTSTISGYILLQRG